MPQAFNHGLRMVPSVSLQNRVHPNPQIQGLQSHRYSLFDMKDLSIQHLLCGLSVGIALSQCKDARDLTDLLSRRGLTACMQTSWDSKRRNSLFMKENKRLILSCIDDQSPVSSTWQWTDRPYIANALANPVRLSCRKRGKKRFLFLFLLLSDPEILMIRTVKMRPSSPLDSRRGPLDEATRLDSKGFEISCEEKSPDARVVLSVEFEADLSSPPV